MLGNEVELLPVPAMALSRCVLDAVYQACWLIDGRVSTEQRLARWAARLLHDTQETPNTLTKFGADGLDDMARVVEGRDLGKQLMLKGGFNLSAKGGDRSDETARVTYGSEKTGLTPSLERMADAFGDSQPASVTVLSGAVHSRGWMFPGLEGDGYQIIASALAPLLEVSDVLVTEVAGYLGLDPDPELARTHLHRTALIRLARPGGGPIRDAKDYRATPWGGEP